MYEKPVIQTLTGREILESIGPVQAVGSGAIDGGGSQIDTFLIPGTGGDVNRDGPG